MVQLLNRASVSLLGGRSLLLWGICIRKQVPYYSYHIWGELSRQASGRGMIKTLVCFISVPLLLYDAAHTKVSRRTHLFKCCFHWYVWHSFVSCWSAFYFLPRGHPAAGWWTSSGAGSRQHLSLKELLTVQQFRGQSGQRHKAGVRSWAENIVKLPVLLNSSCFVVTSWEKRAECGKVVLAISPMI